MTSGETQHPRNHVGAISLAMATGGSLICHLLLGSLFPADPFWLVLLRAGFDAAMVGGLADWFAVTALFRHPLGIPIPHTAIIPKRRERLIDGIVAIVEEEWLSPQVIEARVERFAPSQALLDWLRDPERVREYDPALRDLLRGFSHLLTQPEVVEAADRALRHQLHTYPVDASIGKWLRRMLESDNAQLAFESMARSLEQISNRRTTARKLHDWLEHSAHSLRKEGKRLAPMVLRSQVVRRRIVEAACRYAGSELRHAAAEKDHPLRRYSFQAVRKFALRLHEGDAEALEQAEYIREALLDNLSPESISAGPLSELKRWLDQELDDPDSQLFVLGLQKARDLALRSFEDPANRVAFERWVKESAVKVVNRYHHQIGLTIRESLESIDTDALVDQLEDRLGGDLQYIRLNGALVGGIIGLLLALIHRLLS